LKEKDNTRKRNRAKTILRLQKNLKTVEAQEGDSIFKCGEDAHALYILESGRVDVLVREKKVFSTKPGDIFGEHSMIMGRPRNTSAVCASKHCVMQEMKARDFYEIYNSSSSVRSSLRELCYRREFQKSLVKKTQKEFPSVADLREAFDATDTKHTGTLTIEAVGELLRSFDPSLSEEEIQDVAKSLDLNNSGFVTFEGEHNNLNFWVKNVCC
jgi:CRP-like cAMP-binding protein